MAKNYKKLVKQADDLIRNILHIIDSACITCGEYQQLEVGHWISRTFKGTRWNLKNNHGQCRKCNSYHEENTNPYDRIMTVRYNVDDLKRRSREAHKRNRLEVTIKVLKHILLCLQKGVILTREEAENMQEALSA